MLFYFVETENHPEDLQVLRYSSEAGSPLALHSVSPPRHDRQVALRGRCRTEPAVCAPGWGGRAVEALLPLCLWPEGAGTDLPFTAAQGLQLTTRYLKFFPALVDVRPRKALRCFLGLTVPDVGQALTAAQPVPHQ